MFSLDSVAVCAKLELPHSAPSWILSKAENLASTSLQDGVTQWHYSEATHPPTQPPTRSPSFSNRSNDYWEPVLMCSVPIDPPCRKYVLCPPPPTNLVLCLALSSILSKIEDPACFSLQDEVKLNLYPRVWHS